MVGYDSDSSGADDVQTNVLLGYASKEPTIDDFSQLGGLPTRLHNANGPSGALGKCRVCNGVLSLLLQLNADLPDRFPSHERRLYVLGCRRKACRRKKGSIRAFRGVRAIKPSGMAAKVAEKTTEPFTQQPTSNIGTMLFGANSPTPAQSNPLATKPSARYSTNPFSTAKPSDDKSLDVTDQQAISDLSQTFAEKASVSSSAPSSSPSNRVPAEAWPVDPQPYVSSHIDADKEYLEPESQNVPAHARMDTNGESSNSAADDRTAFESTMDKTFQRFADRLAQNPEQILRYEFEGCPLLYSTSDEVGKLLSVESSPASRVESSAKKMPRCTSCGAARVFEMQLTPHAITELEGDESGLEGMDWGTIIVGVCGADCSEKGKAEDETGYVEEWVGVQWE